MSNHGGSRPGSGRKASGRVGITLRLSVETVERLVNATRLTRGNTRENQMKLLTSDHRLIDVPANCADMIPKWYVKASDGVYVPRCDLADYESGRVGITLRLSVETVERLDRLVKSRLDQARAVDAALAKMTDKQIKESAE